MTDPAAAQTRRSPRPWVVPPGLMARAEPFDGFEVLDELRSALGLLLWQCLRDAGLWAATPAEGRARLFAPGALGHRRERIRALAGEAALRAPLETLAGVLDGHRGAAASELTAASAAVSEWAARSGLPRTALAFAQGAATASPGEPGPAYAVGLLARRAAEHRRA
ncbi:MAG TPA: hypothetical protein VEW03_14135, partial [Longimicrobiaceae bacterium]|nr:hypothetical protein [Longimicrobiaceae bacterium]